MFTRKYFYLIGTGVIIDQLTKFQAEKCLSFFLPLKIIPNVFSLQLVHNYGAAYGILQNQRLFLLGVSIIFISVCIIFREKIATSKYSALGLAFLLMGTVGNFIDRLFLGFVIDFMNIHILP
ncbi:signal peptidase II, partial [Candidatus Margulisiibacteriota bacterium]